MASFRVRKAIPLFFCGQTCLDKYNDKSRYGDLLSLNGHEGNNTNDPDDDDDDGSGDDDDDDDDSDEDTVEEMRVEEEPTPLQPPLPSPDSGGDSSRTRAKYHGKKSITQPATPFGTRTHRYRPKKATHLKCILPSSVELIMDLSRQLAEKQLHLTEVESLALKQTDPVELKRLIDTVFRPLVAEIKTLRANRTRIEQRASLQEKQCIAAALERSMSQSVDEQFIVTRLLMEIQIEKQAQVVEELRGVFRPTLQTIEALREAFEKLRVLLVGELEILVGRAKHMAAQGKKYGHHERKLVKELPSRPLSPDEKEQTFRAYKHFVVYGRMKRDLLAQQSDHLDTLISRYRALLVTLPANIGISELEFKARALYGLFHSQQHPQHTPHIVLQSLQKVANEAYSSLRDLLKSQIRTRARMLAMFKLAELLLGMTVVARIWPVTSDDDDDDDDADDQAITARCKQIVYAVERVETRPMSQDLGNYVHTHLDYGSLVSIRSEAVDNIKADLGPNYIAQVQPAQKEAMQVAQRSRKEMVVEAKQARAARKERGQAELSDEELALKNRKLNESRTDESHVPPDYLIDMQLHDSDMQVYNTNFIYEMPSQHDIDAISHELDETLRYRREYLAEGAEYYALDFLVQMKPVLFFYLRVWLMGNRHNVDYMQRLTEYLEYYTHHDQFLAFRQYVTPGGHVATATEAVGSVPGRIAALIRAYQSQPNFTRIYDVLLLISDDL